MLSSNGHHGFASILAFSNRRYPGYPLLWSVWQRSSESKLTSETAAYYFRAALLPYMPRMIQARIQQYAPINTWDEAAAEGFSTGNFDLRQNEGE